MSNDGVTLESLFKAAAKHNASDLHVKVGKPPILRIAGQLRNLEIEPFDKEGAKALILPMLNEDQKKHLAKLGGIDFAYSAPGIGRFRVNVYRQRGSISMAARRVLTIIPTFEELHLPPVVGRIASYRQGLIIVAGVTGCGKSTTLAAMLDHINETHRCHILTIEDPIEYLLSDKQAFINQREVGIDTPSFKAALKHMVREDPDVILIGEMRDEETFSAGLAAAETGHLVLGTLHSSTVASTFSRILEFFPPTQHNQVRQSLVFNLRSIVCQKLLPSIKEGVKVVPATEVMLMNPIMQKLVKEGEDNKIGDAIRASTEEGMHDFTESLKNLILKGFVEINIGLEAVPNPEALRMALKGIKLSDGHAILA
ncbi:MAG: type IV pilus twitching motility protein PilT [Planctomycetota bacterium]|jgi:twitching motility protein PilT